LAKGLKAEGWKVYALEEDKRSVPLDSDGLPSNTREHASGLRVLVMGNELTGVDPDLLDLCDNIFYIPMRGEKRSFNVAIAFGIAAYALTMQTVES
jgi:tRNA G18 (ribose-2'-O)-methylase SpoU